MLAHKTGHDMSAHHILGGYWEPHAVTAATAVATAACVQPASRAAGGASSSGPDPVLAAGINRYLQKTASSSSQHSDKGEGHSIGARTLTLVECITSVCYIWLM